MKEDYDISCYELDSIVGVSGLTVGKMVSMYKQASKKGKQLRALCELSGWDEEKIKALLLAHGVSPMEMPRKREKASAKSSEKLDDDLLDLPSVDEFTETMFKAIRAMNDMIDAYARQAAAFDEMRKKLAKIREFLDREAVHADEP